MNDHVVNAGLVVVSVLLVLAGLEAALAVGVVEPHPDANWDVEYQIQPCGGYDGLEFHPEYGWIQEPGGLFYDKPTPAQEWERHAIDDEGFRDVYDSGDQGAVVLGDSFTYGYLAGNEDTYPHLLDRWNPDVAVHNYGITSYGPQQYYLVYEDKAEAIDHDLVVVGFFLGNDASDTTSPYPPARPMFNLSDGGLHQTHEPEPGIEFDDYPKYDVSLERRFDIAVAFLDRIDDIAAENDAEVLVVTLPRKVEVTTNTSGWRKYKRDRIDQFAANESSVHTLNTKPALEEAREDRRVYGVYDGHPDDYGYYVIARTIQSWLVEHDDETKLTVTEPPGDPPDSGTLPGVRRYLQSSTESYGFLTKRSRLLSHRVGMDLGLDALRRDRCD